MNFIRFILNLVAMTENEIELLSINPSSWLNIPEPLIKALDLIIKSCLASKTSLKTLYKEFEDFKTSKDYLDTTKMTQESLIKESLEKSLEDVQNNFLSGLTILKSKTKDQISDIIKEIQDLKSKNVYIQKNQTADSKATKELIQTNSDSLKLEILSKHFKPEVEGINLELLQLKKTVTGHERQLHHLSSKLNNFISETNSILDIHRDNIRKNEEYSKSIVQRFESIAETKTDKLKKTVEMFQNTLEKAFDSFAMQRESFFEEIAAKNQKAENYYVKKADEFDKSVIKVQDLVKTIQSSHTDCYDKMSSLEKNFEYEIAKFKLDLEGFTLNCYQEAKEKLIQSYKDDMKLLKKKLDWLPYDLGPVKDMSPLEARLYTLESRLRREETNRIVQKLEIMKGIIYLEIEDKSSQLGFHNQYGTPTNLIDAKNSKIKFPGSLQKIEKYRNKTPDLLSSIPPLINFRHPL